MIRSRQPKVDLTIKNPIEQAVVDLTWDTSPSLSISIGQLMWNDELQSFHIWIGDKWVQVSGHSL